MPRRFQQVDVFTSVAYMGNPVAVVLDGEALDDDQLPRFSSWTNLSETTFVLPPTTDAADYRVRIFSLERELPFAGHPTLGTCHAWLEAGGVPRDAEQIVQECGAGLVRVRRTPEGLAFAAPPLVRSGAVDEQLVGGSRGCFGSIAVRSSTASGSPTGRAGWQCCCATRRRCWRWSLGTWTSTWASWGLTRTAPRRPSRCARSFPSREPRPRIR